jgi:hypothetical protein
MCTWVWAEAFYLKVIGRLKTVVQAGILVAIARLLLNTNSVCELALPKKGFPVLCCDCKCNPASCKVLSPCLCNKACLHQYNYKATSNFFFQLPVVITMICNKSANSNTLSPRTEIEA